MNKFRLIIVIAIILIIVFIIKNVVGFTTKEYIILSVVCIMIVGLDYWQVLRK